MTSTPPEAEPPPPSPKRRLLRKALYLPRASGKASALALVLCMGVTALLVPLALRLPRWGA